MFRFKLTRSLHVHPRCSGSVFRARLVAQEFQEESEMPVVNITWLEGRTVDQKRKVAQRITQVLMEEAGAKSESTHIVIVDIPATNFASGGVTVADKRRTA
jgi:4-oxalocrotonate tautomerase